jgi:ATP-binding cassette subfamily B protein
LTAIKLASPLRLRAAAKRESTSTDSETERARSETQDRASSSGLPVNGAGRLLRALEFARPERVAVGAILCLTLGIAGINAIEPLALKWIFDELGASTSWRVLMPMLLLLASLALGREVLGWFSNWLTWRTRLRIHYALLDATVERIHLLPLSFHTTEGVGAIMTRLDRSIQGFIGAITDIAFNILPSFLYLVIAIVVMVRLDWRLALLMVAFAPLPALIAHCAAPEQVRRERDLLGRWARIYSRFNEVLSGIATVRSFAMEDAEKQRFLRDVGDANRVVIRGVRIDSGVTAAGNVVVTAARVTAIAVGSAFVINGQATVGTLVALLAYVGGLFGPVQGLSGVYQTLRRASVSLDEVFKILDSQEFLADAPDAEEVQGVQGNVRFDGVCFAYEGARVQLLDKIDLDVKAGEHIALVGPSGAGKTTLMSLLQRFYEPTQGAIYIDGKDLRKLKQRSLRRQIGTVLQDPLLFKDTVRNNIAYGRPEATMEEIEAAARAANAHNFITHLPEGYDTTVGERGNRLSTGERQRVAIARALLKNPAIVILDEATSALDAESEELVQEALGRLLEGRTTFIIAHRLVTVAKADKILVMKSGSIIETGTHRELLARNGYYAKLVANQTRGLLQV